MQELYDRINAAEAEAPAGLACRIFIPRAPDKRLSLFLGIKTTVPVEQKEILCALRLYSSDGVSFAAQGSSWPLSSRLEMPYQYLPAIGGDQLVSLKNFVNLEPFAAVVVHLYSWRRRFAEGDVILQRCLAAETVNLKGRKFMNYCELPMLEIARD